MKLNSALAAAVFVTLATASMAQAEWPERPVTILTPWPPGDIEDTIARMISDRMEATYDVPVKALNKPGGRGVSEQAFSSSHLRVSTPPTTI
ncbi:MAG: hypothetical protein F4X97_07930 [Boseongicola sp. SB0662_bin_57]|nr:hypothetical protein [Boseongicola sp. SB0662_bin_57]